MNNSKRTLLTLAILLSVITVARAHFDNDQQMLQWTAAGTTAPFMEREWAYDRNSPIGKLDRALEEAISRKWVVVDMKQDWKVIYPAEKQLTSEKE